MRAFVEHLIGPAIEESSGELRGIIILTDGCYRGTIVVITTRSFSIDLRLRIRVRLRKRFCGLTDFCRVIEIVAYDVEQVEDATIKHARVEVGLPVPHSKHLCPLAINGIRMVLVV